MLPRQAPVCDFCGVAPMRHLHPIRLTDGRRELIAYELCVDCRDVTVNRIVQAAAKTEMLLTEVPA